MLTTKYVRENADAIRKSLKKRKSDYPLDELLELDEKIRKLTTESQEYREKRNRGSVEISEMVKSGKKPDEKKKKEMANIKEKIDELDAKLAESTARAEKLLWNVPNVLHESVPYGKDDTENVEIRKHGTAKHRKDMPGHEEILKKLDMIDLETAAKVSGARFYYLKGDIALLEQSLIRFAIDQLIEKGFTLIAPPLMLKKDYYRGVTALGEFEDVLYKVTDPNEALGKKDLEKTDEDLYLIGTSEHPMAVLHSNSVLSPKDLPKKYVGISPCFRREAGAHGKDTKGIFRVHQFYKVEQFVYSNANDSWKIFEELMKNTEDIYKKLEIPYRIVNICTGDIGTVAAKKYDLEAYMPSQDKYREMASCSNCTDWQSVRLDIRYDESGERKYVHTLNDTAIATERTIVAIVENYYNEEGTITVPKVLQKYMGKKIIG